MKFFVLLFILVPGLLFPLDYAVSEKNRDFLFINFEERTPEEYLHILFRFKGLDEEKFHQYVEAIDQNDEDWAQRVLADNDTVIAEKLIALLILNYDESYTRHDQVAFLRDNNMTNIFDELYLLKYFSKLWIFWNNEKVGVVSVNSRYVFNDNGDFDIVKFEEFENNLIDRIYKAESLSIDIAMDLEFYFCYSDNVDLVSLVMGKLSEALRESKGDSIGQPVPGGNDEIYNNFLVFLKPISLLDANSKTYQEFFRHFEYQIKHDLYNKRYRNVREFPMRNIKIFKNDPRMQGLIVDILTDGPYDFYDFRLELVELLDMDLIKNRLPRHYQKLKAKADREFEISAAYTELFEVEESVEEIEVESSSP